MVWTLWPRVPGCPIFAGRKILGGKSPPKMAILELFEILGGFSLIGFADLI